MESDVETISKLRLKLGKRELDLELWERMEEIAELIGEQKFKEILAKELEHSIEHRVKLVKDLKIRLIKELQE